MKNKLILLLAIGILVSCSDKKDPQYSQPIKITEEFFKTYQADGPIKAVSALLPSNKYISSQDTDMTRMNIRLGVGLP